MVIRAKSTPAMPFETRSSVWLDSHVDEPDYAALNPIEDTRAQTTTKKNFHRPQLIRGESGSKLPGDLHDLPIGEFSADDCFRVGGKLADREIVQITR